MIILYVTHANETEAQNVVDHLLQKKMVACANILPIRSCYLWNGEREVATEVVTLLKTTEERWQEAAAEIRKIHPYDVPCIIKLEAPANDAYEQWIRQETQG